MKQFNTYLKLSLILLILNGCHSKTDTAVAEINLIPQPVQLEKTEGYFQINTTTEINTIGNDDQISFVADYFNTIFNQVSDYKLKINKLNSANAKSNTITLEITNDIIKNEGYNLSISKSNIHLKANEAVGLFYGIQTLRQLLPIEIDGDKAKDIQWGVPAVTITDYPRFGWRGLHLDVSRHFYPKAFIKKYIDHMVRYKLNVFHWHLVDGAGWRMPIDAYPNLTETGAWRIDKTKQPWDWTATEIGKPTDGRSVYGGFYTKEDIKEIIAYAKERFVEVIPEIEMPGHSYAALVAYPELACINNDIIKEGVNGKDVFCAGNEKTYEFLETILDETMALFPSNSIHIGGDEVSKEAWHNCSRCQNRMKKEGLQNEEELQSYFIKRMAAYVESKGREIIGWDEIMEGGLAKNAKVMSWRGMEGGIKSANMGHDVIMAPNSHTYFDLYQGDPAIEPPAYSRLFLTDVYKFDPVPKDIDPAKQHHILGGHACLWTETVQTPEHAEYMIFPRLFAMAETVWSPKENLNWKSFVNRMEYNFKRLDNANINYAKSAYDVTLNGVLDTINHTLKVSMSNELNRYTIRYTLDGSNPTPTSTEYKEPFTLSKAAQIKAAAFKNDIQFSKVSFKEFLKHMATGKKPVYTHKYAKKYSAGGDGGLVNGLTGSNDYMDKQWQGFQKDDLQVIIDLGKETTVNTIKANFFHNPGSWIYLPKRVNYALSTDGENYKEIAHFSTLNKPNQGVNTYQKKIDSKEKARYVKVFAKNIGYRPNTTNQEAWIFIDEIIVE